MTEDNDALGDVLPHLLARLPDPKNPAEAPKFAENVSPEVRGFIEKILPKLERDSPILTLVSGTDGRSLFARLSRYTPEQQVAFVYAAWLTLNRKEIINARERRKRAADLAKRIAKKANELADLIRKRDELLSPRSRNYAELVTLLQAIKPKPLSSMASGQPRQADVNAQRLAEENPYWQAALNMVYVRQGRRIARKLTEENPHWVFVSLAELIEAIAQEAAKTAKAPAWEDFGMYEDCLSRQASDKTDQIRVFARALAEIGFSGSEDALLAEAIGLLSRRGDFEPQHVNKALRKSKSKTRYKNEA